MRIVVNHVTRMTGSRICVAGIDTVTYRHVRPVTGPRNPLTRELLRDNGGPFGAGALVDIGTDVRFYTADLAIKRDVVKDVNRRLATGTRVYAMLGLARAIRDEAAGQDLHWLMANGLCLADRAVGDLP